MRRARGSFVGAVADLPVFQRGGESRTLAEVRLNLWSATSLSGVLAAYFRGIYLVR